MNAVSITKDVFMSFLIGVKIIKQSANVLL